MLFAVMFAVLAYVVIEQMDQRKPMDYPAFKVHVGNKGVAEVLIKADQILGELNPMEGLPKGDPLKFVVQVDFVRNRELGAQLQKLLEDTRTPYKYDEPPGWFQQMWPQLVLWGGLFLLIWLLVFRRMGQAGGGGGFLGNFGRSRHRVLTKEHTGVTFEDVAGIDEAEEEVAEIIMFLRNPRKFQRLGGRIPRGILLVGEPGCGKTLLARAIAGEADVPFFSISGSDFVEMFVGVGASRVRDLFRQAKESSPCIIFLDEIDAVGRRRTHELPGGGQETSQTLNAILVEMDGFETDDQVIVLAATNRADVLDPALTRPGRFDRQVQVPLPDLKGRYEILRIYTDKIRCGPDVDLDRVARGTPMFSGADLEALVNEAAIAATLLDKDNVELADFEEARDKVRWGRARKSRVIDEKEREISAYHEAGHALLQVLLPNTDPLHKVSIIPRGPTGGSTTSLPEKDRYLWTRKYCESQISVAFGGRIAEEQFCGDISSGAQSDIAQATYIARKMIVDWGMSEKLGLVNYSSEDRHFATIDLPGKEYSDQTAALIDSEIRAVVDDAERVARETVQTGRDALERLAKALLSYETLTADEVQQIIDGKELTKPSVGELLERERAKSAGAAGGDSATAAEAMPGLQNPPLPDPT